MLLSKKRWIHALSYEGILLIIIALGLSHFMDVPLEVTGILGIAMATISVLWNMVYNHYFEKIEKKYQVVRGLAVRVVHAIGFEGGLVIVTVPMMMYALQLSLWNALALDISLTLCIMVYTFIFQWCFDQIEERFFLHA